MHSKSILSFLTLGLLSVAKINGYIVNNYTGKCKEIYTYLEDLGKRENFNGCEMNEAGEVIEVDLYSYCLEEEELAAVLSYDTIETVEFAKLFLDWNLDDTDDRNIIFRFGCASLPSQYKALSTLTNLKNLDLTGVKNLDSKIMANIPKSIEQLRFGRMEITQEIVDVLSKLTNLKNLILVETQMSEELDFSKFENLKNLTTLEIYNKNNSVLNYNPADVQGDLIKYCKTLKNLYIIDGIFNKKSLDSIGNLTELEQLTLEGATFEVYTNFSSLKNLKNLISLSISCSGNPISNFSPNFFYLTKLKRFTLTHCTTTFNISSYNKLNWANLKDLEYLDLRYNGPKTFNSKYLGDLPNLKEAYLSNNQLTTIPESIGNIKNLEVLDLSNNAIKSLPETLGNLEKLRMLRLSYNELTSLPEKIGNLKDLEILEFSDNSITGLPESISELVNLKKLVGGNNKIVNIPTEIGNLTKLEDLVLAYNEIAELPKSIGNLKIRNLRLLHNQIGSIPDEIGNMTNLELINLAYNKIVNIPSTIGNLENLEEIYLGDNLIDDELPASLNKLPYLKILSLERNINIKGKTLSSPKLRTCHYYPPSDGYTYSICEAANATCKDYFSSLQSCEEKEE